MSELLRATCPCCKYDEAVGIGKLPDSHWFAGQRLKQPLFGGFLYRCCNCHLKFRSPVQDEVQRLYDNAVTANWPADVERRDWDLISQYVFENVPNGGCMLDFGCYSGGLLARLSAAYRCYGIEINRAAAAIASASISGRVWPSIEEIPQDLRFDVVVAADVIEHVRNPLNLIEELSALTTENGFLIVTTGDADNVLWNQFGANWWYCFYPEHISFLSEAWLNYLCEKAKLFVVRSHTFSYCDRRLVSRCFQTLLMYSYGWWSNIYLFLANGLRKVMRRPELTSVPGSGVSQDHLFIVLAKAENESGIR